VTETGILIVGGGAAAHGAVGGLRRAGYRGRVTVVGREADPPYQRPPLSKRYLLGEMSRQQLLLPPVEAELRVGAEVAELDLDRHLVRLADGERIRYEKLLLATGGRSRRLPGDEKALHLRDIDQSDSLRRLLLSRVPLEIRGAGFIGCEVAAAARKLGVPVLLQEALAQPLLRVFGPELGGWLGDVHRERGVELHTNAVDLPTPGTTTLVAVGSLPNTELAERAGLACQAGIVVDGLGQASAPDVYAAGDCARFWSAPLSAGVRVEHFQTAVRHGESVGAAMAGLGRPFDEVPWFWSDQYELNLQYVGAALPWDETVVRGRFGLPPFTVFYLEEGRLVAAAGVNEGRTVSRARRLIAARLDLPALRLREILADPAADLRALAGRR